MSMDYSNNPLAELYLPEIYFIPISLPEIADTNYKRLVLHPKTEFLRLCLLISFFYV